jgi:hypothetical protein
MMVNRGSLVNKVGILQVKGHTVEISMDNYIDINKNLNLEKLD